VSTSEKRFQFYGRRKGKTLRRHHSELMHQLLPQLRVTLDDPLSGMGERRWLEIGFHPQTGEQVWIDGDD